MQSVDILVKEHELIGEMLETLTVARDMLEKRDRPPKEFFEKAILLARDFADRYHHFKEEFLLFGLLAQKKDGAFDAEIGALRYEHERGRKCINDMAASIEGYAREDEIATARLLENLAAYISILKRHIYSEDHGLFKLAEQELSDSEDKMLVGQFQQDEEHMGDRGVFHRSRRLIGELSKMLGGQKC